MSLQRIIVQNILDIEKSSYYLTGHRNWNFYRKAPQGKITAGVQLSLRVEIPFTKFNLHKFVCSEKYVTFQPSPQPRVQVNKK